MKKRNLFILWCQKSTKIKRKLYEPIGILSSKLTKIKRRDIDFLKENSSFEWPAHLSIRVPNGGPSINHSVYFSRMFELFQGSYI